MSSYTTAPNFDNLLLQTLMGRLQIRPPNPLHSPPSLLNQTLEDLLLDTINNLSESDNDDNQDEKNDDSNNKNQLAEEESKLEREIIRTILTGKVETLKPNSGQAVAIGEHHICVGYHEESEDYRVWEWHGHIMMFDEENGYTPEYIYGNYFERVTVKPIVAKDDGEKDDHEEDNVGNLGLRELIETVDSASSRILHRNINAGTRRF